MKILLLLLLTSCTTVIHKHTHYWVIDASGDIKKECEPETLSVDLTEYGKAHQDDQVTAGHE